MCDHPRAAACTVGGSGWAAYVHARYGMGPEAAADAAAAGGVMEYFRQVVKGHGTQASLAAAAGAEVAKDLEIAASRGNRDLCPPLPRTSWFSDGQAFVYR